MKQFIIFVIGFVFNILLDSTCLTLEFILDKLYYFRRSLKSKVLYNEKNYRI